VPLLGQIPLVQSIRESGDVGRPALLQKDSQIAETFKDLASAVIKEVEARNGSMQPTKKVEITTQ
jgi:ATP-binding protein involved in chromosome partitioning